MHVSPSCYIVLTVFQIFCNWRCCSQHQNMSWNWKNVVIFLKIKIALTITCSWGFFPYTRGVTFKRYAESKGKPKIHKKITEKTKRKSSRHLKHKLGFFPSWGGGGGWNGSYHSTIFSTNYHQWKGHWSSRRVILLNKPS